MAYIVSRQEGKLPQKPDNFFFQYKADALKKYNELSAQEWVPIDVDKVPYRTSFDNCQLRIERIAWSDIANDKFIFFDNEENRLLVLWDRATFWAEYTKLTKKYEKNNREWSDFYDKLEKNLLGKGVQIIWDIQIIREKDLDWK